MQSSNTKRRKYLWTLLGILLLFIVASSIALISRLNTFLLTDSGAINLISGEMNEYQINSGKNSKKENNAKAFEGAEVSLPTESLETLDDQVIWETDTEIEIFKVSYENDENVIPVKSDNEEKVIAPGTENSYTFKLKNTGELALDYKINVEAYFTPEETEIPITWRISRYDEKWLIGDREQFQNISDIKTAEDEGIVGAGRYIYYTLDWQWLFEGGDDDLDTLLGNMATEQDLTLTIKIETMAESSEDIYNNTGILSPKTGDINDITPWFILAGAAVIIIFLLIVYKEKHITQEGEKR